MVVRGGILGETFAPSCASCRAHSYRLRLRQGVCSVRARLHAGRGLDPAALHARAVIGRGNLQMGDRQSIKRESMRSAFVATAIELRQHRHVPDHGDVKKSWSFFVFLVGRIIGLRSGRCRCAGTAFGSHFLEHFPPGYAAGAPPEVISSAILFCGTCAGSVFKLFPHVFR